MAFHAPFASAGPRRGSLEEGAARDLVQVSRRLETPLGTISNEMAVRRRTILHSARLGATGMELGQLARDVESLERLSIAAAAKAHAQPEKIERARGNIVVASRFRQMLERFEELQRREHAHAEQRGRAKRRLGDETAAADRRWRMAQTAGEATAAR